MRSRRFPKRSPVHLAALVLVLAAGGNAQAQALQVGTLRIESTPSGAEVELIGGKAGVTPLTITERDIYPNSYPDARAERYGMITLRHAGCEPLTHRVTLDDLKQDLHLRLDCIASASTPAASRVPAPLAAPATLPPAPVPSVPQRRLRQLEVLQELLDEGLITPAEEQRVRRRILQPGTHPGH